MDKKNHLDEVPIAQLTTEQLQHLQQTENQLNEDGSNVYLIAFQKQTPSQ